MKTGFLGKPLLAALCLALAACASGGGARPAGTGKDDALQARAVERWNLLIAGKTAEAWEYLSAGVRSTKPKEQYASEMANRPVKWESVAFESKECAKPDACTVRLVVEYSVELPIANVGRVRSPAVIDERWIAVDGNWYHVPAEFVPAKGLR